MSPFAYKIKTPTDFKNTIGHHDCVQDVLFDISPEFEPAIRHSLSDIFDDLPYIDSNDPGMVSAYLDSIEKPLNNLNSLGIMLYAISSKGSLRVSSGEVVPDWHRVYYLVVPADSYYSVMRDESSRLVDSFNPDCTNSVKELLDAATNQRSIKIWNNREALKTDLEGNIPWCPDCGLGELFF